MQLSFNWYELDDGVTEEKFTLLYNFKPSYGKHK